MGQVRSVQVHRLLAADSVDQRLVDLLGGKTRVFDQYARPSDIAAASPEALDISEVDLTRRIVAAERARLAGLLSEPEPSQPAMPGHVSLTVLCGFPSTVVTRELASGTSDVRIGCGIHFAPVPVPVARVLPKNRSSIDAVQARLAPVGTTAALIAWLPMSASVGFADDAGGATLTITAPDEFTGSEQTISVAAHTASPVPDGTAVVLDVRLPARLSAVFVHGDGMDCPSLTVPTTDVTCTGVTPFRNGGTQITVPNAGTGDDVIDTIQATLRVDGDVVAQASKDVHIVGIPSHVGIQIDAPDQARTGDQVTLTATFSVDHAATNGVGFAINVVSARLTVLTASAPGYDCTVQPRRGDPGISVPSSSQCTGDELADSVTLTVTATVEPGARETAFVTAAIDVGKVVGLSKLAEVTVVGSDTTTVSGVVWNDLDRDGRRDPGEPGVAGVVVTGNADSHAVTDENGAYTLTDMAPGPSKVLFVAPERFDFTTPNVDADIEHDSDVTSVTRKCPDCVAGSLSFTLVGPLSHLDAGLVERSVSAPVAPIAAPTPTHGAERTPTAPAPQAGPVPTMLASTGVPVSGMVAIGVLLLAAGVALLNVQHRRFQRRDHASDQT